MFAKDGRVLWTALGAPRNLRTTRRFVPAVAPPPQTMRGSWISSSARRRSTFRTAFPARIASFATLLPSRFVKRRLGICGSKLSVGDPEFS